MVDEVRRLKQEMRAEASSRRDGQPHVERLSRHVFQQIEALPEYASAHSVMLYLDFRSEVHTRWFVPKAWDAGKRVVVPHCQDNELGLFLLTHFDELTPGMLGVLEPKAELCHRTDRRVDAVELDLIVAPGLAFDRRGGRLGYGKGYYDRLLHRVRADAVKVGVCFECQIFPEIPLLPHDIRMDGIVTEKAVYQANS
jgi:5-formyltetrahydrofolate cyclo-ligase